MNLGAGKKLKYSVVNVQSVIIGMSSHKASIELIKKMIIEEGSPTERAGPMIEVHPTVETIPMENVLAVAQPPDLLPPAQLVQADGAATAFSVLLLRLHGAERQELAEDHGGNRRTSGCGAGGGRWNVGGSGAGLQEVRGKAQEVEEGENDLLDDGQQSKGVD